MRRREFLLGIGGTVLGTKVAAAQAQQAAAPVIGVLTLASLPDWAAKGIHAGLKEAGYVENVSLTMITRSAGGHFDRLPALASDLVQNRIAVIFAMFSPVPTRAAMAATSTIPIVFAYGGDPVVDGLVRSLNRPGGNVTGATFIGTTLLAKRFELMRAIVPDMSDVALLVNPMGTLAERQIGDAKAATEKLGLKLHVINMSAENEIEPAFEIMKQMKVGAFVVSTDPFLGFIGNDRLVALAARYKIPAIYNAREAPDAGGLIGYGPNRSDTWRQATLYVARILKGEKPSDLPVLQPTSFETVVNLKTATELGLTVPSTLLSLADDIID